MKTKQCQGFTLIEFMIVAAIVGIAAALLLSNFVKSSEEMMRVYVGQLYQPVGQVRVACKSRRCTAVFMNHQEQEKTVIADCDPWSGCAGVPLSGD